MYVQIMTEEQARNHYENPFDITKIWRHKEFPLQKVGVLELNRNPENYFAEVEQSAFTPAHVVPGIGFHRTSSAGPFICLRRRAEIPSGHQLQSNSGQPAQGRGS